MKSLLVAATVSARGARSPPGRASAREPGDRPPAPAAAPAPSARPPTRPASRPSGRPGPSRRYAAAVDAAHRARAAGLDRGRPGQALARRPGTRSTRASRRVAELASRPGVVGIKIADELGYHDGLDTPEPRSARSCDATATALRQRRPGKLILVDMIVPELGCLPGQQPPLRWATICAARARGDYPQLALPAVDSLRGQRRHRRARPEHLDPAAEDVRRLGLGRDHRAAAGLAGGRPARLGHGGSPCTPGGPSRTPAATRPAPRTPTRSCARSSTCRSPPVPGRSTCGPGARSTRGRSTGCWTRACAPTPCGWALRQRRAAGAVLFTHFTPSSVEVGLDADLAALASVFTDVFIAAGTG